jgi:glycosyltransferase involved in cell wall biosynthesis
LLLPSRIRPHQNIGLGLRVLAELRQQSGQDFRLLVSGPPETARAAHLDELLKQREALGLSDSAHFLYAVGAEEGMLSLDRATVANLYHLADALFYPSRHEGFGSPMLEAALAGRPIFCADIPPFRLLGGEDAHYFDPQTANPATLAGDILAALRACPHFRLRVRTRQHFRWETIIREQVAPLLA